MLQKEKEGLTQKKNLLLSTPLKSFQNIQTRILYRNTWEYYKLLKDSYHPVLLNKRNKREKFFLSLKKSFNRNEIFQEMVDGYNPIGLKLII